MPNLIRVLTLLRPKQLEELQEIRQRTATPVAQLVRQAIDEFLERYSKSRGKNRGRH